MVRTIYTVIVFLAVLFSGCKKDSVEDEEQAGMPEMPQSLKYDLDKNGTDDFELTYSLGVWDGVGASGMVILGHITPLNDNAALLKFEDGSGSLLFNRINDTIHIIQNDPYEWTQGFSTYVVDIFQGADGNWPNEWRVQSEKTSNPHYLAVLLRDNEDLKIGWLRLIIDKKSGQVTINKHKFSSGDYIVIDD